ncbi:MAG TPA: hypothetical protein V6D12_14540 [Candidatus Obscuribacterales bacterium]
MENKFERNTSEFASDRWYWEQLSDTALVSPKYLICYDNGAICQGRYRTQIN